MIGHLWPNELRVILIFFQSTDRVIILSSVSYCKWVSDYYLSICDKKPVYKIDLLYPSHIW